MRRRPIGYYVHHHGAGHRARADAIARACEWPVVMLGTNLGEAGIDLPDDRPLSGGFDGVDAACFRPDALHYAPLDHDGVRERVARIGGWIAVARPALMVVDVSVEVAMLARLASVPTICVRLNGKRDDPAHLDAWRGASALFAPFHCRLEAPSTLAWVRGKTTYLPGITADTVTAIPVARRILVVFGRGGQPGDGTLLASAARACPQWQWRVIGPAIAPADIPPNLVFAGWVDAPEREIAQAALVVGAAGDGLVGAVMAADRPFVCIPEERPFDEQQTTARSLQALDAAIVLPAWPNGEAWPAVIAAALSLRSAPRRELHDAQGARKAAAWLSAHAEAATSRKEQAA
ncbi:glycosyltransferase [Novosphingobium sp. BL-52-GroH]|uniref:glycosyltransferase n=1 Tax=Novosphingobium sp. BL-52-GroH TaxID=3349877 RepID=UPI00384EB0EF